MEKINELKEYLIETSKKISGESLSEIDFDKLAVTLKSLADVTDQSEYDKKQLQLLRDDYTGRISGMVKAIAVVSKKQNLLEESHALIESLKTMDAAELIETYRRVQARFQESFPASFGHLRTDRPMYNTDNLNQYK